MEQRNAGFVTFFFSGICTISSGVVVSLLQEEYGFAYGMTGTLLSLLLFAFAFSMAGMNPTAVASAGKMTTVTSMGIMLPVASSGAILMPWVIGKVAESAGLAVGMATNIVPCVGLIVFAALVARMREE